MAKKILNFIHISDIHFHKQSGGPFDLDLELRLQLENDVKSVKDKIGDVFGILVTGDIAYSGQKKEDKNAGRLKGYTTAKRFSSSHHL